MSCHYSDSSVDGAIEKLKIGKSDGYDGLSIAVG